MTVGVLYVAGAMRSGSTLLGMVLGSLPGFFNVGEIKWFWADLIAERRPCGCGSALRACPFWSRVVTDLEAEGFDVARIADHAARFEPTAALLRLAARRPRSDTAHAWEEFVEATRRLYASVARHCEGAMLVDVSKLPAHLHVLQTGIIEDLRILHLVRDGRAVAWAWHKRHRARPAGRRLPAVGRGHRSALGALAVWAAQNALLAWMARRERRRTVMRYEDFAARPAATLAGALAELDVRVATGSLDRAPLELAPGHGIAGSDVVRFGERRRTIVLDDAWVSEMTRARIVVLTLLGLWPLRRLGYPLRPPRQDEAASRSEESACRRAR